MENLADIVQKILCDHPYKIVMSKPVNKEKFKKIVISYKKDYYQIEKFTDKQVFHENIKLDNMNDYLISMFKSYYLQLNAWGDCHEYNLRVSKKGKTFLGKTKNNALPSNISMHDRKKNYILEEGTIIEPLIDMGIFTKEGVVVKSMYDKYKQINRFIEMIDDSVKDSNITELTVIDFGCGKSYLTFILYYYFTTVKQISVKMIGLDLKEDVIVNCNNAAQKYGYKNLKFELGDINGYKCDFPVDMVITLHACDTATDFALYNAIKWDAKMIFSVPCCQHELNAQIASDNHSVLTKYGIVKERVSALMTDAIRGSLLEYCGYKTQLLEFIDFSHTPKNILIRAVKQNVSTTKRTKALLEVLAINQEFHLKPTLFQLLVNDCTIKLKDRELSNDTKID